MTTPTPSPRNRMLTRCSRSRGLRCFCENLCKNETFRESIFVCSHRAQVEFYDQIEKKGRKPRETVALKGVCHEIFDLQFFS